MKRRRKGLASPAYEHERLADFLAREAISFAHMAQKETSCEKRIRRASHAKELWAAADAHAKSAGPGFSRRDILNAGRITDTVLLNSIHKCARKGRN